jgi:hypothetical protein
VNILSRFFRIAALCLSTALLARATEYQPGVSGQEFDEFSQRLFDATTKHLNQLSTEEGKVSEMKGKSAAADTALAYYLMFQRSGTSRYRPAAVALADGILREMKATKLGVLPIKEKDTPDGETIIGGGPPAFGEYIATLAYIYHGEEKREEELKYLGKVVDEFAWNANGWWAADVDVTTGQSKAPLAKPSPINKNASMVLASGVLGEYLSKIDPPLAKRLKAKADKCLYEKILPAQEGDGFWHYSLVGKDPKNKDILGYFMLTTQVLMELQHFNPLYRTPELDGALRKAQTFAASAIAPMTDPNTGPACTTHSTPATPKHFALSADPKRGFELAMILIGAGNLDEGIKIMDVALAHFPYGNAGQDGAHAAEPTALALTWLR